MYYPPHKLAAAAVCAILAGCVLHFLYAWIPNAFTALFSPICESLWEHGKLIFWPYLLAALWLNRGRPSGIRPWMLVLLGMIAAMLALGVLFHILLQVNILWVDLLLYGALMALGFWLPTRFSGPSPRHCGCSRERQRRFWASCSVCSLSGLPSTYCSPTSRPFKPGIRFPAENLQT